LDDIESGDTEVGSADAPEDVKMLMDVNLSQFAGVPEGVGNQSPYAYVAEDAADETEMARQAEAGETVGWDPGAEQERGDGRRGAERER
jgi:hypothetical protein